MLGITRRRGAAAAGQEESLYHLSLTITKLKKRLKKMLNCMVMDRINILPPFLPLSAAMVVVLEILSYSHICIFAGYTK